MPAVILCSFVVFINRFVLFGSESDTQYVVVVVLDKKMALTLSQEMFVCLSSSHGSHGSGKPGIL